MDEAWEKAVAAAAGGQAEPRALTLDGAVKCANGRLPPRALLERFRTLEHLSIANVRLASVEDFPRLQALRRLILSDNRIAGGLDALAAAGLDALRDIDLSNNRIQSLEDLVPLAKLQLVSLDLYECPVTKIKDYRSKVFGMLGSLKYLDKMDAEGNERPDSDDEDDDDEDEEEEDEEEDGEVDGDLKVKANGSGEGTRLHLSNGSGAVDEEEVEDDEEDLGEEVDGEDEEEEGDEEVEEDEQDGEEVEDARTGSTEKKTNMEGEIDGHEQRERKQEFITETPPAELAGGITAVDELPRSSDLKEEIMVMPAAQPKDYSDASNKEVSSPHKRKKGGNSVDDSRPSKHH